MNGGVSWYVNIYRRKCPGWENAVNFVLVGAGGGILELESESSPSLKRTISSMLKTARAREIEPARCVRRSSLRFEFVRREVGRARETVYGRGGVGV